MHVEITIKNYRCFPDTEPLRFEIKDGFIAFVGINNSGKSSILRFFYEFRNLFALLRHPNHLMEFLRGGSYPFGTAQTVKDDQELFCDSNNRDLSIELVFPDALPSPHAQPTYVCISIVRGTTQSRILNFKANGSTYRPHSGISYTDQERGLIQTLDPALLIDFSNFREILDDLVNCMYVPAFRNAINTGTNKQYFDITVGQSFITTWQHHKTGSPKKNNELIRQVTRDISSIFDLELEINSTPDNETFQIFVGKNSFKLNELGAGIAQFILVLGSAAIRNPSFVLIDEPELNLHPSLQLDFLTTLASYAKRGVLFSTHSMGLARASADRIYAVRRIGQGESQVRMLEGLPRYAEFLGELSFRGYQELGVDRILLVEGSTELRTIQQYLRLLKIDHQVVLLPLGGATMINGSREQELMEIKRLSNNVSALIDSEKASENAALEKSRVEFVEACKRVGIDCHVLKRRAIENYFTDSAVKKVKGGKYRALPPYEKLEQAAPSWAKSENWKIARQMDLSDLEGTDLLLFLEKLLAPRALAAVADAGA